MNAHRRLLRLQKKIHGALQADVRRLVGPLPAPILKYERAYKEAFRACARRPRSSSRKHLTQNIRAADVTLIADYHTLSQAQRTALRLIQDAWQPGEKWVLGLEFVPSHRQRELDEFQFGRISEEDFLEKVHYNEEWGFPWEHYAPLVHWAIEHRVKLLALNRPREIPIWRAGSATRDLTERDRWAAGIITDLFLGEASASSRSSTRSRVIILYGELHVGEPHLPSRLAEISTKVLGKPLEWLAVHQNNDSLYWKHAQRGAGHVRDVLQLNRRHFHVISSTPWSKLQSVVSWAEGAGSDPDSMIPLDRDEDEFLCDLESESLSRIQAYAEAMADLLKLPPPDLDRVNVQSAHSADFVDSLEEESRLGSDEKRLLSRLVVQNARFFVPRTGLVYLGTPTINGAAELAAIILAKGHTGRAPFFGETTDSYFQSVMDQAFGFFGSLLVNPRRKCDLPEDHLHRYLELRKSGDVPHEAKARLFTLAGLEEQARFLERTRTLQSRRKSPRGSAPIWGMAQIAEEVMSSRGARATEEWLSLWLSSRYLGKILGKLLHRAVLDGEVSLEQVRELSWQGSDRRWRPAEVRYWEWVSTLASQPLPTSKRQNI